MRERKLTVDSAAGGNGDVWMRLVGFYAVAGLLPHLEIRILVPKILRNLARFAFGDRLIVLEDTGERPTFTYTSMGLRSLLTGFAKGNRYVVPYHRAVIKDKKKHQLKDSVNVLLFNFVRQLGLVQLPAWKWITSYQGYLEIVGLDVLKSVSYDKFVNQLQADHRLVYCKLQQNIPCSDRLRIPPELKQSILVFPTGTGRQFVPVWWASKFLPHAYFAFFFKDAEALEFEKAGLKTVKFYEEPGDIIALSHNAKWTISTDSFPSHLLQSATTNCTIILTEFPIPRTVSPAFPGKVVNSQAVCHPCLHLDRKNHPTCAAGYTECINWKIEKYAADILQTLPA